VAGRRYQRGGGPADPSQRDTPSASSTRSTRQGRGSPAADPNRDPGELAREICLRQLAVRPRTRAELAAALHRRGIAEDVIEQVLDRYDEVGIINDEAFARAWVASRHHGKGLARAARGSTRKRSGRL
jgi:regulatory protein